MDPVDTFNNAWNKLVINHAGCVARGRQGAGLLIQYFIEEENICKDWMEIRLRFMAPNDSNSLALYVNASIAVLTCELD